MATTLDHALALAEAGFHVFPLIEGGKTPLIDNYPQRATRDPDQIRRWWTCPVMGIPLVYNIAISTTRFGDDKALVVIDVDKKNGVDGDVALTAFEAPPALTAITPTGGRHLIYVVDAPLNQHQPGALGAGLDLRSRGGYIVAPGSITEKGEYRWQRD